MKFRSPPAASVDVDMTPMIDVTFQLISFFMMVTNFEQTQADERIKLPSDALAKPPEVKLAHELVVNIGFKRSKTGEKLDPQPYIFLIGEELQIAEFRNRLLQEARIYQATDVNVKDVTVVIRADTDVPTGKVQEFIKMSQEAKFEKFTFKAKQKGD